MPCDAQYATACRSESCRRPPTASIRRTPPSPCWQATPAWLYPAAGPCGEALPDSLAPPPGATAMAVLLANVTRTYTCPDNSTYTISIGLFTPDGEEVGEAHAAARACRGASGPPLA